MTRQTRCEGGSVSFTNPALSDDLLCAEYLLPASLGRQVLPWKHVPCVCLSISRPWSRSQTAPLGPGTEHSPCGQTFVLLVSGGKNTFISGSQMPPQSWWLFIKDIIQVSCIWSFSGDFAPSSFLKNIQILSFLIQM